LFRESADFLLCQVRGAQRRNDAEFRDGLSSGAIIPQVIRIAAVENHGHSPLVFAIAVIFEKSSFLQK